MTALLEVKNLHVFFKTLHAVRGIDFTLHKGEIVGVVGESGSGKSASAKALLRLFAPHATTITGSILYEGKDLVTLKEKQLRGIRGQKISMIFQDPMTSLNPTMTIGEQILEGYLNHFPKTPRKEALAIALSLLEMVGISDPKERLGAYPHTLSGGMRQRVMIAIALACKPDLLIADEATTALDVTIQAQILELMKDLQRKLEMSILLITHDLSVVASFCDRVLVMYAGKIVENAPVEKLFSQPEHPYTRLLLKAIPKLHQSKQEPLIPIEGAPPLLTEKLKGCSFAPRCPFAMSKCHEEEPILTAHKAACFL